MGLRDRRQVRARGRSGRGPVGHGSDRARPLGGRSPSEPGWARLSQELRTPLNAILGNAELLLDGSAGPLSGQARACLGDIQAAGQHMLRQAQALVDLCHARTCPRLAGEATLDLIELLRAALAAAPALGRGRTLQVMPADARCLLRGETPWLGVLAAALVELEPGASRGDHPLLVAVERGVPSAFAGASPAADGAPPPEDGAPPAADGARLRLWWRNFEPDQVAALPVALIDAILDLHGGAVALTGQGLQLDWPAARVGQIESPAGGLALPRKGA